MKKHLLVSLAAIALAGCGGGGDDDSKGGANSGSNGASPPVTTPPVTTPPVTTTPGAGSTTPSAETPVTNGAIRYAQYQSGNTAFSDAGWSAPLVDAVVNFNATSQQGSIQFPVAGGTQAISTTNGYDTVAWSGPFSGGAYRLAGNALVGCSGARTQVFISSSLQRLTEGTAVDALTGLTFDMFDCGLLQQSKSETLKFNTDGSLTLSIANATLAKNEVFNMLNAEKYGGALINNGGPNAGGYSGQAFRYTANGMNRHAIVIQTNSPSSAGETGRFHYYLAIQR